MVDMGTQLRVAVPMTMELRLRAAATLLVEDTVGTRQPVAMAREGTAALDTEDQRDIRRVVDPCLEARPVMARPSP